MKIYILLIILLIIIGILLFRSQKSNLLLTYTAKVLPCCCGECEKKAKEIVEVFSTEHPVLAKPLKIYHTLRKPTPEVKDSSRGYWVILFDGVRDVHDPESLKDPAIAAFLSKLGKSISPEDIVMQDDRWVIINPENL